MFEPGGEVLLMTVLRALLIALAVLVVYPYLIYPPLLWLLSRLGPRPWKKDRAALPSVPVSVLIAAHNEQGVLQQKLENTLAVLPPGLDVEIVVISDASTDRTDEIARGFGDPVRLIQQERGGKQVALNRGVAEARGEILLFTDAAVFLEPDAALELLAHLADPTVGAVSSIIHLADDPQQACVERTAADHAEATYLGFDLTLRAWEAAVDSTIGCCGSCYAVRRDAFRPFDAGSASDFLSALDAARAGYRVVLEPRAVGWMRPARSGRGEFRRKVRTICGGLDTLWRSGGWKTGFGRPIFWWFLMSHKVARWLGPPALLACVLLVLVGAALGDAVLVPLAVLAAVGIGLGATAALLPRLGQRFAPWRLAGFAFIAWLAGVWAWVLFLIGRRQVIWQPTQR